MLQHVLNDKVALIVGVQTDLCQSIALQMAKFGCRIAIGNDDRLASQRDEDNRKDKLNSNNNSSRNQQSRSIALVAGANKIIVDTIDAFGRLDFLILNVGAEKTLSIELTDELLRRAAPHLAASNGLVVNVTGVSSVRPLWLACSFATGVIDMIERHQQQKPNWLHSKTCLKSHYVSDTSVPGVRITSVGCN